MYVANESLSMLQKCCDYFTWILLTLDTNLTAKTIWIESYHTPPEYWAVCSQHNGGDNTLTTVT